MISKLVCPSCSTPASCNLLPIILRAEKTMTATDVTGFYAIFSTGFFATSSRFSGALLTKLQTKPGERAKNPVESLQWRQRPEITDFCLLSWSNWPWTLKTLSTIITLRAKGTLIREPRFVLPATCDFCHAIQGKLGFGKRGLLEKGSFQKSPCSRDSREFRDSRDFREPPECGKERRIQPFSRDSREFRDFRDSRDFSSEKTPFVMTPFPKGPFRTKNSTALESVLFRHRRSFSVSVPFSCLFFLEKQALLSPLRSVLLRPYRIYSPYRNSLSVEYF